MQTTSHSSDIKTLPHEWIYDVEVTPIWHYVTPASMQNMKAIHLSIALIRRQICRLFDNLFREIHKLGK